MVVLARLKLATKTITPARAAVEIRILTIFSLLIVGRVWLRTLPLALIRYLRTDAAASGTVALASHSIYTHISFVDLHITARLEGVNCIFLGVEKNTNGGVTEWPNVPVLKTGDLARGPRVQISPPPPMTSECA